MRQGAAIFVRVRIPGNMDAIFLVDTGATYSTLSIHLAEQIGLRPRAEGSWETVQTASGTLKAPWFSSLLLRSGISRRRGLRRSSWICPVGATKRESWA